MLQSPMIDSSYLYISAFAFSAMVGGSLIGLFSARALPSHHLSRESADVVKTSTTIVATLTSLVLALMLSSANSSFSINAGIVKKLSADLIQIDHMLRAYGPEANGARANLRAYAMRKSDELFPGSSSTTTSTAEETASLLDALLDGTLSLSLPDRRHTALAAQALALINSIYAERWLLWENPGTTVPPPFIFLLVFWLFLIFLSFGLFAPWNLTVITSFVLSALAVTGALFLILELGDPMEGWLRVSGEPLRRALIEIGRP